MDLKEAKQIIESMGLNPEALTEVNSILDLVVNPAELSNEEVDKILAIIDQDIDDDELKAEAVEDVVSNIDACLGKIKGAAKMGKDQVDAVTENVYEDVKKTAVDESTE